MSTLLRDNHIGDLVYPHTTVLDDSIGCALWFAAGGKGLLNTAGICFMKEESIFCDIDWLFRLVLLFLSESSKGMQHYGVL